MNGSYERYVTLSEQEIEKLKTEHRLKAQPNKSEPVEGTEISAEETIAETIQFLEMPTELKGSTKKLLLKLFQESGQKADDMADWLEEHTGQFMEGPNPFSLKCNLSKWKEWAQKHK